ncbi:MAG TPA: hypothetical protein VGG74_36745 [Kofleriaceae bacterium]|jgi:S1-C subfamily serine protease
MTGKLVAIVLAAVAVVLAGVSLIVVATRGTPAVASTTLDTRLVAAADVVKLGKDPLVTFDLRGAHVGDAALAGRLGLLPGDTIVALSGRALLQPYDLDRVAILDGADVYVELSRAGSTIIARWKLAGSLHDARTEARLGSGVPWSVAPPPPSPPDPLLDTIVRDDKTHFHLPRSTIEAILADPMKYATVMRVVPAIANGVPSGFKLYAIHPGSLPTRVGLENGDRLDAINGMRLDSAEAALEAYAKLRHTVRLDLSLTRRDQPVEITISIN